jgi:hypothetical protein
MATANDKASSKKRVPYLKYAFHNIYNYTLLGGVAAAALLTQNWWMAVVGGGLETLWLVFAPDSKIVQKKWFDKVHAEELDLEANRERDKQLASLPVPDAQRFRSMEKQKGEILRLCAENERFTQELLRDELGKLDQLVDSFLDLMISSHRYEQYLATVDVDDLEADLERYGRLKEKAKDETQARLAEKNLAVLEQRREKIAEIRRFVSQAFSQMDLIENSFRLLADQIVTMRSPKEMGGQLDELNGGVEAVRSTARETESFLQAIAS